MKNQLRKATLRAAALTMSATIAATSVPMTAFAQDTNEGNDDNQKKQVSENPTGEQEAQKYEEKTVAPAIVTADEKVDAIKVEDAKNIVVSDEMKSNEEAAKQATEDAVEAEGKKGEEKTVANEVSTLEEKKEAVDDKIDEAQGIIDETNKKINEENEYQENTNNSITGAQEEINKAKNKEDAQKYYDAAVADAKNASDRLTKANSYLSDQTKAYKDAMAELEDLKNAYNTALTNSIDDIEVVKGKITEAQGKVAALKEQISTAKSNIAMTAAELLAEEYNKENKSEAEIDALFKTIVEDYYVTSTYTDAQDGSVKIGDYDKDNGVYPVSYWNGREFKTIYVTFALNKENNGITVTEKKIEKELDTPAVEEHYIYGDNETPLSVSDYKRLAELGTINTVDGKDYYGVLEDKDIKVGENDEIKNVTTVIGENGHIQVIGDVTTIAKTANSLAVPEGYSSTYDDEETAKQNAREICADLNAGDKYAEVEWEVTPSQVTTGYTATAFFVPTEESWGWPTEAIKGFHPITKKYVYDSEWYIVASYVTYADVQKAEVPYTTGDGLKEDLGAIVGYEKLKRISIEKSVEEGYFFEDKEKKKSGFVVGFNWINLDSETADLYYVEGERITATGATEEEAKANLNKLLKGKRYKGEKFEGTTPNKATQYTITLTGKAKTTSPTVLKESTREAQEVTRVDAKAATYKDVYVDKNVYDNAFLNTAASDAQDRNDKVKADVKALNEQLNTASDALTDAQTKAGLLEDKIKGLQNATDGIDKRITQLNEDFSKISLKDFSSEENKKIDEIKKTFNGLPSNSSNNNNSSSNNNNNNNNQPGLPTLPAGPIATTNTTNTTPTQQVVTLVDDQTPLSATADDTVAPKTNKKAAKKNAAKTTDSDSKKTNKNNTKKQPKKVTPEVEDDTIDEDLEIVSLDDEDKVPLAPGVASNDSTKDIMDETSSVSWLWLIILAVASVVTFGTYKGVKKHNENKGKNNR